LAILILEDGTVLILISRTLLGMISLRRKAKSEMNDTLRNCMIAEQDYTFLSLDASQIELRVLAILSGDTRMIEDIRTGDLHQATATRMFGWIEDPDLRKKKRYDAKQVNFAMVYGADEFKLSEMLDCSLQEAKKFMVEHRTAYPRMYQWAGEKRAEARANGFVVNMFGRKRPLPELYSSVLSIKEKAEREVVNTIVQGTAVDIVKMAMLTLRDLYPKSIRLILQVHDEMVWEVPDELLDEAIETSKELNNYFPNYPFTACVGKRYGSLKELKEEGVTI
jgi:DNA polymerase-1